MRYERESQQGQADAELNLAAEDEAILVDFFARQRTEDPTDGGANDIFDSNAAFATLPVASRHALFQAALRTDFYSFVQAAFPVVSGGKRCS